MADGTPGVVAVRSGGLTSSDPGAAAELLAFNAYVRRAGEWMGRLSFPSRGGLERDGDDSPHSRVCSLPSSEAETIHLPEGRLATLERDGDHPAGPRGVRMGRVLGFFESFPFFQIGRKP